MKFKHNGKNENSERSLHANKTLNLINIYIFDSIEFEINLTFGLREVQYYVKLFIQKNKNKTAAIRTAVYNSYK